MGVTLWLLDEQMRVRRALVSGIAELIHDEAAQELTATLPMEAHAVPGEYLGLACVDGRFRLFAIDEAHDDDTRGATEITATDAARAELETTICRSAQAKGAAAAAAVSAVLAGTAWTRSPDAYTGGETGDFAFYYQTLWDCLTEIADGCGVRILPRYTITGGQVTGRVIDVEQRQAVFRGRIFLAQLDAQDIYVTRTGRPVARAYGLGKATGSTDPPERVTIADAVWSVAAGDPADKPAGQDYVETPRASGLPGGGAAHAITFTDNSIDDPGKLLTATWAALQERAAPVVGGEATVQDVEMLPGMDYKAVRLYDQVAVVTRGGQSVMTQVTGIARDYVYPARTKLSLGSEDEDARRRTLSSQVGALITSEVRASGSRAAMGNRIIHNESLIQLNADAIQLNAKEILAQAEQIKLRATYEELVQLEGKTAQRFNEVGIILDAHTAELLLTAKQKEVSALSKRVSSAEVAIDGANAQIAMKASQEEVNSLGQRVSSAEVAIDGANAQIALKVSKDGVIGAINLSTEEALIQAARVNLVGYVTASQLSAELASFRLSMNDSLTTNNLSVNSRAYLPAYVTMNSHVLTLERKTVVTNVETSNQQVCRSVQVDANGNYSGWRATTITEVSHIDTEEILFVKWS